MVFAPSETPPQPIQNKPVNSEMKNDYKVERNAVFRREYWDHVVNYMEGLFTPQINVTFQLINNKRLPLSRGKEGSVMHQLKL